MKSPHNQTKRTSRRRVRSLTAACAGVLTWALALGFCVPSQAIPPPQLQGISLPVVLQMYDRARWNVFAISGGYTKKHAHLKNIHTIVLDPGHGGSNLGAIGVAGIHEKYLTINLAYELRNALQQKYPDLRVIMTRYWDTGRTLTQRTYLANLVHADLFMSLHYNAATRPSAVGYETYFLVPRALTPGEQEIQGEPIATTSPTVTGIQKQWDTRPPLGTYNDALMTIEQDLKREEQNRESGRFAEAVQAELRLHLHSVNRGVKEANYGVLRGALMPAIVVESGFLTHPVEGLKVLTAAHRHAVVVALMAAIANFDKELSRRNAAGTSVAATSHRAPTGKLAAATRTKAKRSKAATPDRRRD